VEGGGHSVFEDSAPELERGPNTGHIEAGHNPRALLLNRDSGRRKRLWHLVFSVTVNEVRMFIC
jgi:hypothetical protein